MFYPINFTFNTTNPASIIDFTIVLPAISLSTGMLISLVYLQPVSKLVSDVKSYVFSLQCSVNYVIARCATVTPLQLA